MNRDTYILNQDTYAFNKSSNKLEVIKPQKPQIKNSVLITYQQMVSM